MSEAFVKIDLHGLRQEEAMKVIDKAIASAGPTTYQLQMIHGYNRGTSLRSMMREKPDLIVLQSRSPSCGVKQRYDGTFTGTLVDGEGVTAQLLMENGFKCVDVEDL